MKAKKFLASYRVVLMPLGLLQEQASRPRIAMIQGLGGEVLAR
jgi:hypothetical protein